MNDHVREMGPELSPKPRRYVGEKNTLAKLGLASSLALLTSCKVAQWKVREVAYGPTTYGLVGHATDLVYPKCY